MIVAVSMDIYIIWSISEKVIYIIMLSKDLVSILLKILKLIILGSPLYINGYFSNIKIMCYKYYLHIFCNIYVTFVEEIGNPKLIKNAG